MPAAFPHLFPENGHERQTRREQCDTKYFTQGILTPNSCNLEGIYLGYQIRTHRDVGTLRHNIIGAFLV